MTAIYFATPLLSYASLPTNYSLKSELELMDGTKMIGIILDTGNGCMESTAENKIMVGNIWAWPEENNVPLTDEFFLERFVRHPIIYDENGEVTSKIPDTFIMYKKIHKFNYFPKEKENAFCHNRMACWATLKSDEIEIKRSSVKKIHALSCEELGDAPVLEDLDEKQIQLLQKPAEAFFDVEQEGVTVNLISYNSKFNTTQKLQDLIKDFLKKRGQKDKLNKAGSQEEFDFSQIANYEKEFRASLPEDIQLLIYHVTD